MSGRERWCRGRDHRPPRCHPSQRRKHDPAIRRARERLGVAEIAETDNDPFATDARRAERELGSLSAALAFEPSLDPSDQMPVPSVLEALPYSRGGDPDRSDRSPRSAAPQRCGTPGRGRSTRFRRQAPAQEQEIRTSKTPRRVTPKTARIAPAPQPAPLTAAPEHARARPELDSKAGRSGHARLDLGSNSASSRSQAIYFVFGRSGFDRER
jgi:hypothetical protein